MTERNVLSAVGNASSGVKASEQAPANPTTGPSGAARARRKPKRRSTSHQGELCPLVLILMPFAVPLYLAHKLRRWLRRRLGRKAGNAIGKVMILAFGGPPMIVPRIVFRLVRLMQKLLNNLDKGARTGQQA